MEYYKVGSINDLHPGEMKKTDVQGHEILLANVDGTYYAIDDKCPHMGASLSEGKLEGTHVICPRHGSVFDVTNGAFVEGGKLLMIRIKTHDVGSYPVKIEGADILAGMEQGQ